MFSRDEVIPMSRISIHKQPKNFKVAPCILTMKPYHTASQNTLVDDFTIDQPLFQASINRVSDDCPFSNDVLDISVRAGQCVWLRGGSGSGKTLTAMQLANIQEMPGVSSTMKWPEDIPESERVGMLFQGAVLIDTLTVEENIALALRSTGRDKTQKKSKSELEEVKRLQTLVSLQERDLEKMPGQLSGGMLRRVALAQLLAQGKRLIILDEPFVGLDPETAVTIGRELKKIRNECGTALILISHIKEYADLLEPEVVLSIDAAVHKEKKKQQWRRFPQLNFVSRFLYKLADYFLLSLPLIFMAFIGIGFALTSLLAYMIEETQATEEIKEVMDREFSGDAKIPGASDMLTSLIFAFIRAKMEVVIGEYVPEVKERLYAIGTAKMFVMEVGPLLTAMLLAGRIGGSYAGEVGTMQATNQNRLLRTLRVSPRGWSLMPSLLAAFIAAPALTILGSLTSLWAGSITARTTQIADEDVYWRLVKQSTFNPDCDYWGANPSFVCMYRSFSFIFIILAVAEYIGRYSSKLQPRNVPFVITSSVVISSLLVIFLDWGFSKSLLDAPC